MCYQKKLTGLQHVNYCVDCKIPNWEDGSKKKKCATRHGKKFVGSCQGWLKMQLLKKEKKNSTWRKILDN